MKNTSFNVTKSTHEQSIELLKKKINFFEKYLQPLHPSQTLRKYQACPTLDFFKENFQKIGKWNENTPDQYYNRFHLAWSMKFTGKLSHTSYTCFKIYKKWIQSEQSPKIIVILQPKISSKILHFTAQILHPTSFQQIVTAKWLWYHLHASNLSKNTLISPTESIEDHVIQNWKKDLNVFETVSPATKIFIRNLKNS